MPLRDILLPLPLICPRLHGRVSGEFCSRHTSSLRQLVEMPSLAGPKSRAHLASFARLDDGAFCRVISASFKLWAPPTYASRAELHPNKWCSWRLVWSAGTCSAIGRSRAFFSVAASPHRTPVPPIVLDRHSLVRYVCLAGRSPREIDFPPRNCRSGGPVVERPKRNLARRRSTPQARALPISRRAAPKSRVSLRHEPLARAAMPSSPSSTRPQAFEAGRSKRSPRCRYLVCMMTGCSSCGQILPSPMVNAQLLACPRWYLGTCMRQ